MSKFTHAHMPHTVTWHRQLSKYFEHLCTNFVFVDLGIAYRGNNSFIPDHYYTREQAGFHL